MRLIAIYGVLFGICNPFLVFFSIVITSFQCLVWLKLVVITSTTPRFTKVINSWVIHVHLYYLGSICSIPFRAFIWHLRAWVHMVLTECDQLKSIFKTRGPSNSLTWVSLSLVYSKGLWFLFIGLHHTCHISHCEIKSHRIWPIWKAIPIKNSNLTEFSGHFTTDFMKK